MALRNVEYATQDVRERQEMAIHAVAAHFLRHGPSLLSLIGAFGNEDVDDATMSLLIECSEPMPDPGKLFVVMQKLVSFLDHVTLRQIREASETGIGAAEFHASFLWHGAKLSDQLSQLKRATCAPIPALN
ncbi:hypothetical protein ACR03S_08045 [Limimaricola variabilis]